MSTAGQKRHSLGWLHRRWSPVVIAARNDCEAVDGNYAKEKRFWKGILEGIEMSSERVTLENPIKINRISNCHSEVEI